MINAFNPIHISMNMSGKMEGIDGISTSVLENPVCKARRNMNDSICQKCFAAATASRYSALRNNLSENLSILSGHILSDSETPSIYADVFRLEAFGDLANVTHARNYIKIARKNPNTVFTLWTKNYNFLYRAFLIDGKPENFICGLSSVYINRQEKINPDIEKWFDFVFTVYSAAYAIENNIKINCGGKKCRACMNCYGDHAHRKPGEPIRVINELLKQDLKKYVQKTGYAFTDKNAF